MTKHKIISLIIALFIAIFLWAYTITNISPESTQTYYSIPVHFTAENVLEANGLVLVSGRDQKITLTIRGNRSDLAKLNRDNIKISASLGAISEEGISRVSYTITYPDTVAGGDLAVEEKSTEKLQIETKKANTKTLNFSVMTTGTLPEGYLLENAESKSEFVTVFGPADEIDRISKAKVEIDISGMTASTVEKYPFAFFDAQGEALTLSSWCTVDVKRSAEEEAKDNEVFVRLDVLYYRDLEVTPVITGVPEGYEIVSKLVTPKTARVTGNKEDLDELKESLTVHADLRDAEQNGTLLTLVCPIDPPEAGVNLYGDNNTVTLTVVIRLLPVEPTEPDEPVD